MGLELRVGGLSKTYSNGVRALDKVSLTIPTGLFGLGGAGVGNDPGLPDRPTASLLVAAQGRSPGRKTVGSTRP